MQASAMQSDMAVDVAQVLREGDLFGHDTHGLALLTSFKRLLLSSMS